MDRPRVRHTLQLVAAPVIELDSGPGNESRDSARHQHFTRLSETHDARRDVYRDAVHIPVGHFDLAGV